MKKTKEQLDAEDDAWVGKMFLLDLNKARYKNKAQLLGVGFQFKCICGKIHKSKDSYRHTKQNEKLCNAFGGTASINWDCGKCGRRCSIEFNLSCEKKNKKPSKPIDK